MPTKKRSTAENLFTGILAGFVLFTVLLLWACALSTYLPPDRFPRLSLAGLAFPVFLSADLVLVVMCLLFRVRMTWIPLIGVAAVGSFVLDYCPVNRRTSLPDSTLCVLSYNAGGVTDAEGRDSLWGYLARMKPDIVCLQEVSSAWFSTQEARDDMQRVGLTCLGDKGNYVLSRLPLHEADIDIHYDTQGNGSYACWVMVGGDSVLVVSNHLESNRLSSEDKDEYRHILHCPGGDVVRHEGRALARKLARAARLRGPQADTLCALVARQEHRPVLLCGDFNDTPISYTYRRLSGCLTSAYRQSGCGMGFSFNQDEFFVRIDHIFFSQHFQSLRTLVDRDIYLSDHYPIVTYLLRRGQ